MIPTTLRTYNPQKPAPKHAIYILSRGRNAGKPLLEPCPNCYVLKTYNSDHSDTAYWMFYALWKNRFFHPYLCGSVIEMLRLSDLRQLYQHQILDFMNKSFKNPSVIEKIKATWQLEQKLSEQAAAVHELRNSLLQRYYLSAQH